MKIVILDAKTLGADVSLSRFEDFGALRIYEMTSKEQTIERVRDVDIVLTNKVVLDKEVLSQCPSLRYIGILATGTNNIDLEFAKEQNITVKNASNYSSASVAQHTLAMVLALLHGVRELDLFARDGWSESGLFTFWDKPFFEIEGKTWGIIGLGNIGKKVASVARGLGAEILSHSPSGVSYEEKYNPTSLASLLQNSDIISIHSPLNEHTLGLIGKDSLLQMKDGAILVSVARGGIVNESDLCEVLEAKPIYVGLDVLAQEPIAKEHRLLQIKHKNRLLLTPHSAWASVESRKRLLDITYQNIHTYLTQ